MLLVWVVCLWANVGLVPKVYCVFMMWLLATGFGFDLLLEFCFDWLRGSVS